MEEKSTYTFIDGGEIILTAVSSELVFLYCKWVNDPIGGNIYQIKSPRHLKSLRV